MSATQYLTIRPKVDYFPAALTVGGVTIVTANVLDYEATTRVNPALTPPAWAPCLVVRYTVLGGAGESYTPVERVFFGDDALALQAMLADVATTLAKQVPLGS